MKKSLPAALVLAVCLCSSAYPQQERRKVCAGDACLQADVAVSDAEHRTGLMLRESLEQGTGMLFVFESEAVYPFWMMNMRFPIDIIWISADKRVVYVYPDALPCRGACESIIPPSPARYVLEVPAGYAARHHIGVGDPVDF